MKGRLLLAAWIVMACGEPVQAAVVDCFVICLGAGETCDVATPAAKDPIPVTSAKRVHIERCREAALVRGTRLNGLFKSARGLEKFEIAAEKPGQRGQPFAALVRSLADGSCVTAFSCTESRDRVRLAAIGGKGIDASASRRVGSPCAWGLPCGTILRPSGSLTIELAAEGPADGRLRLSALRGAVGGLEAPVASRRIALPAQALQAGAAYAYSLIDTAGMEVAAGEFTVMSARMQTDVEADLDAARRGDPQGAALGVVEILLDNELYWDAMQPGR